MHERCRYVYYIDTLVIYNFSEEVAMKIMSLLACVLSLSGMIKENDDCFVSYGFSCRQGLRPHMEDQIVVEQVTDKKMILAVLDGHCNIYERGKKTVDAFQVASHALCHFIQTNQSIDSKKELLNKAFAHAESMIEKENAKGGTTATVAYFDGQELSLGWVGDSQAVLIRNNNILFKTINHKPSKKTEELRIELAGGVITDKGAHKDPNSHKIPRINGLAMSRSLGDMLAKKEKPGALSPIPDIEAINIHPGDRLLMASDGFWDIYSSVGAHKVLNSAMNELPTVLEKRYSNQNLFELSAEAGDKKLSVVARCLCNKAYDNESTDNISVLVATFFKNEEDQNYLNVETEDTTEFDVLAYYCSKQVD